MQFGAKLFISILEKAANIVCNCLTIIYTVKNDEEKEKIGKALFSLLSVSSILLLRTIIVKTRKYLLVKKALKLEQELKLEVEESINNNSDIFYDITIGLVKYDREVDYYNRRLTTIHYEGQNRNEIMLFHIQFINYLSYIDQLKWTALMFVMSISEFNMKYNQFKLELNNFMTNNSMEYNLQNLIVLKGQVLRHKNDSKRISTLIEHYKQQIETLVTRLSNMAQPHQI
ncbi:uncharacterized protein RJT21DRAFT_132903 [Scheffersomyces amazonensis]|uniref:uncharacterized protein n=1 Tax=Scheffersomyces amazonensis TaxID=1078765 RepID=UPI00315D610A